MAPELELAALEDAAASLFTSALAPSIFDTPPVPRDEAVGGEAGSVGAFANRTAR